MKRSLTPEQEQEWTEFVEQVFFDEEPTVEDAFAATQAQVELEDERDR